MDWEGRKPSDRLGYHWGIICSVQERSGLKECVTICRARFLVFSMIYAASWDHLRQVARTEGQIENPRVGGSIPSLGTTQLIENHSTLM
jgi:hypothetical protein